MAGFLGHNSFIAPGCLFTNFGALCTGPFSMQVLTHQDLRDPGSYVNVNTPLGPIVNCLKYLLQQFTIDLVGSLDLDLFNFRTNCTRICSKDKKKSYQGTSPILKYKN